LRAKLIKGASAVLLAGLIAVPPAAGLLWHSPTCPVYTGGPVRAYADIADTEEGAPPGDASESEDDGVTYTYSYVDYRNRVTSDLFSNSSLSEYLAGEFVSHAETFSLSDYPEAASPTTLISAVCEAYYQNNAFIGGIELNDITCDFHTMRINIPYALTTAEQQQLQQQNAAAADSIAAEIITPGMSDYQKEAAINDYLCANSQFDYKARDALEALPKGVMISNTYKYSQTAYGVLINHHGVCQSFAEAYKLIADSAGLPCIVVTGVLNGTGSHMWNRVEIDGQWMTLDVTNNGLPDHPDEFLNLTAAQAAKYYTEDDRYILSSALSQYK